MNRKQLIGALAAILGGAALLVVIKVARRSADASEADEETAPSVVTVQTGRLERITLHGYVEGFGSVVPAPAEGGLPAATSRVAPATPGVVAKVHVAEGQTVERGAPLVDLDARAAAVAVRYAEETMQRQKRLYAENNASLRSLQEAQAQLETAQAQWALLQIVAPLSGTVTQLNVRPGEAVDLTTTLAQITDLSRMVVAAEIPSGEAARLHPGEAVQILATPEVSATLAFVSSSINPANDTVSVRAPLPPGCGLRVGQPVRLRIVTAEHTQCLAAPAAGVVAQPSGQEVVAVVSNGEATQVPVKTGLREGPWVEVEGAGLKVGSIVVTVGAYGLPEKTRIRTINP